MKDRRLLIFILLFLLSGLFAYWGLIAPSSKADRDPSSLDPRSEKVQALVNGHLSVTSRKLELQEARLKVENSFAPRVGDRLWPDEAQGGDFAQGENGVDFSNDTHENSAYEDLDRHPKEYSRVKSPHHQIQNENFLKDESEKDKQSFRESYAEQFIENARRQGYLVRLNEDLVVISVQKISGSQAFRVSPEGKGSK